MSFDGGNLFKNNQIIPTTGKSMSSITHSLKINGMSCGGCSTRLESVLASTRGVIKVEISHQENSGVIITDENIDLETIIQVINSAGFDASN